MPIQKRLKGSTSYPYLDCHGVAKFHYVSHSFYRFCVVQLLHANARTYGLKTSRPSPVFGARLQQWYTRTISRLRIDFSKRFYVSRQKNTRYSFGQQDRMNKTPHIWLNIDMCSFQKINLKLWHAHLKKNNYIFK